MTFPAKTSLCAALILLSFTACKTEDKQANPRGTNLFKDSLTNPDAKKNIENSKPDDVFEKVKKEHEEKGPVSGGGEVELEGSGVNNGIFPDVVNYMNCKSDEGTYTVRGAFGNALQGVMTLGDDSAVHYCLAEKDAEKPRDLILYSCFTFEDDQKPVAVVQKNLHSGELFVEINLEAGLKTMACKEPEKKKKATPKKTETED